MILRSRFLVSLARRSFTAKAATFYFLIACALVPAAHAGGKKPKPTPTPTPAPLADGETDWKNTGGTDWNTGTNWTAVTGSAPPAAGDVAWFKTAFSSGQPNLSASTSIAGFYFTGTGTSGY